MFTQGNAYDLGYATVSLIKAAGVAESVYAFQGKIYLSKNGWLLLSVPNALVRGAFDALHEPGVELPTREGELNAHISIMTKEEVDKIGEDNINDRGHTASYMITGLKTVVPASWDGVSKVWFLEAKSPQLEKIRKSYGLSPLLKNHAYHITIGIRRTRVLYDNEVSKAAVQVPLPRVSQSSTQDCGKGAMQSIGKYYGDDIDVVTHPDYGAPPADLVKAALSNNYKVITKYGMTVDNVRSYLDDGKAVIVCLQAYGSDKFYKRAESGHYSVVIGYDDNNIYLQDPMMTHREGKRSSLTIPEFETRWMDEDKDGFHYNRFGMVVWKESQPVEIDPYDITEKMSKYDISEADVHEEIDWTEYDEDAVKSHSRFED